jgi:hypothetical protein
MDRLVQVDACGYLSDPVIFVYELGPSGEQIHRLSDIYGCDVEGAPYPPAILDAHAGKQYLITLDSGVPNAWIAPDYGDFTLYLDDAGPLPAPPPPSAQPTGQRAAALKKCKKKHGKARKKCTAKAKRLPV